ncbi:MAG: hypothetical protein Fur005_08870 [Roseiflexaceae bacterium]
MQNPNRQQIIAGGALIMLGLVWWLNLWSLILPAALIGGGVAAYFQRRSYGRRNEAMQALLWGIGMGLLILLKFVWPGVLFVAGLSILLRGREDQVESAMQLAISRIRRRTPSRPAESVPVETIIPVNAGSSYTEPSRYE